MPDSIYIIIIGLLVIGLGWSINSRDDALQEIARLEQAETNYKVAISAMKEQAEVNEKELAKLREIQGANHEQRETVRTATSQARRGDESFEDFMATPLPTPLCPGGGLLGQDYTYCPASP